MLSYVYFYDNESKDLFGVQHLLIGYNLATLEEVVKQGWADERDEGRMFVLAEGEFEYRDGCWRLR